MKLNFLLFLLRIVSAALLNNTQITVSKSSIATVEMAGVHTIDFNAGNLASGIYIYTIKAKARSDHRDLISAKKMVLLK